MTPKREDTLTTKAVAAMRDAVRNVVEDHRRRGRPLVLWRDGQVVREMPAQTQAVHETTTPYGTDAQRDSHGN